MSGSEDKSSGVRIGVWVFVCLFTGLILVAVAIPNFVKARSTSAQSACINNLRQIDGAKNEWALETSKTNGTHATEDDIKPYAKFDSNGNLPKCPQGGIYTIGLVGGNPTCSLGKTNPNHVLP
jgi:hypothetical protein